MTAPAERMKMMRQRRRARGLRELRLVVADPRSRTVEVDRQQITLVPECLENWICEDNSVRVIDVCVGGLDMPELHFGGLIPRRPAGLTHRSKKGVFVKSCG